MNTSAPAPLPSISTVSDADLVSATLAGDRRAFRQIVERYQRLLCSLAYSATGQLSQSEDLAQETFIEAWRHLADLREPEKLRPWLCGILRFKVSRLRRADEREPVRRAGGLDDTAEELISPDEPAAALAIQKEEQALMWSALERVPDLYREPLILYYRENRSVEHVASALELTEDAVKQRLARGRKILQERVLALVEGALVRSTPGRIFTLGVLAAIPEMAAPAKAAGIGAAAAHGGMLAKTTGLAVLVAWISGLASAALVLRANLDQSRTPRERRGVVKITCVVFFSAFGFLAALYGLREAAFRWWETRAVLAGVCQVLTLAGAVGWIVFLPRAMRGMRALRSAERRARPESFRDPVDQAGSSASEYRSRWTLLGVPLMRIRFSSPDEHEPPVFAWFAGGDRAYGLIAAWGGCAVAPIAFGAISAGFLAIGSLGIGVISYSTVGIGVLAIGAASIGVKAFAWLSALGWETAQSGGFAIARIAAEGPIAFARHANDPVARELFAHPHAERNQMILLIGISLLALMFVALYANAVRRRLGGRS